MGPGVKIKLLNAQVFCRSTFSAYAKTLETVNLKANRLLLSQPVVREKDITAGVNCRRRAT